MSPELSLTDVRVDHGEFRLGPVDLRLAGTGLTVLVGPNGAGKSTLIRSMTGLQRLTSGSVAVGEHRLDSRGADSRAALRLVGYVPQEDALPRRAKVRDVLRFAAWLKMMPAATFSARLEQLLPALGLAELVDRRIDRLSGGERQRVSIAVALVHDPQILILDEPTAGLDPVQRVALRALIGTLARHRTLLVSTHLVEDIDDTARRVLAMTGGRLIFDGTHQEVSELGRRSGQGASNLERGLWTLLTNGASDVG